MLDLTTQIVATNAGEANASGPGGLRHAGVIGARASTTFNLVSTRVLTLAKAGSVTVRLRIAPSRIDGIVSCYFYNAAFTVLFVP